METGEQNKSEFSSPRSYDPGLVVWRSSVIIQANGQHDKKVLERMIGEKNSRRLKSENQDSSGKAVGAVQLDQPH